MNYCHSKECDNIPTVKWMEKRWCEECYELIHSCWKDWNSLDETAREIVTKVSVETPETGGKLPWE